MAQRYGLYQDIAGIVLRKEPAGEYVSYDDFAHVKARLAAAEANLRVTEFDLRNCRLQLELERQGSGARMAALDAERRRADTAEAALAKAQEAAS